MIRREKTSELKHIFYLTSFLLVVFEFYPHPELIKLVSFLEDSSASFREAEDDGVHDLRVVASEIKKKKIEPPRKGGDRFFNHDFFPNRIQAQDIRTVQFDNYSFSPSFNLINPGYKQGHSQQSPPLFIS